MTYITVTILSILTGSLRTNKKITPYTAILRVETVCSSDTLDSVYMTIRYRNPDDENLNNHQREIFKFIPLN
jgi:hypothetical protein